MGEEKKKDLIPEEKFKDEKLNKEISDEELESVSAGASPYVKKKIIKEIKERLF